MNDLKPSDFERIELDETFYYLRHEFIGWDANIYEVCLEQCLNGFDVAVYIKSALGYELAERKYCTNVDLKPGDGIDLLEALTRALAMATIFKNRYAYKMQETTKADNLRNKGARPTKIRS